MPRTKGKDEIRDQIEEAIEEDGQYTHNIISCNLRIAEENYGRKFANSLIDDLDLKALFGIEKEKEVVKDGKRKK